MFRAPLLAGSRIAVGSFGDDVELLLPPPPGDGIADVEAAVRDALRFPLAGEPLEALVPRGGRVTIVLDSGALPLPPPGNDPRRAALAATIGELVAAGVPTEHQTIVVASGLARRPGSRELEAFLEPPVARRFEGALVAHDAEHPALVPVGEHEGGPLAVHPALVETDAVVVVSAAETVVHGGPGALLGVSGADTIRGALGGPSLLESRGTAWDLGISLERGLAERVPLLGVSLALAHPRWGGALRDVPYHEAAVDRFTRSPVRRTFGLLPGGVRRQLIRRARPEVGVHVVFAGRPSVAHAEALLRGVEQRARRIARPLGGLVIGIPPLTPHPPVERPNPLDVAYLGLGHALRLNRGGFPLAAGGALVMQHRFHRRFAHPTQAPYRTFFGALRGTKSAEPELLVETERAAAENAETVEAYRAGRSCHPRLPFAQWDACAASRAHVGAVVIAGCRDATAARLLGFVPARGLAAALEMARGIQSEEAGIGVMLTPPFFPLELLPPSNVPGRPNGVGGGK